MRPTRYYSDKQEKRVAKAIGGKRQSNSGATVFDKGDIKDDEILYECKTKTSPSASISIKKEWLEKVEEEAFAMGRLFGALVADFGDGKDYVMVKMSDFQLLYQAWKELNDKGEE